MSNEFLRATDASNGSKSTSDTITSTMTPRFTDTPGAPTEADVIPTIRDAFDRVFSQSLASMGVTVKTDDASGLGDPGK